ncbi:hypothetical protein [Methylobacterium nodulans]|uniref:Uncharacterized protein n=1 Tax=Methylobacterium nodulans (strain LMG 21967 / CNCM I-2342 / ORS 2060) TaxID=460265 RepID=B8IRQ8_METNO|nr:hypothetical protein [Methylobacterium nodulans]ACL60608.1 conserved hypothetical protein [Methylobacterium nodulans ORS 2060]
MVAEEYFQPVVVNTGAGGEHGTLVFIEGQLVAVLTQINEARDTEQEFQGKWFLEAGFGPCKDWNNGSIFASKDKAVEWVREQVLMDEPVASCIAS